MTQLECVRTDLDDSKYSSPVPVIGLYIAVASLVCSILMLYDIVFGFIRKKQWLPCRWFSLNSVTLTLLSIAAKIPVDLTTRMPGTLDQFSKLSGTTLVCVSMGFLMPSLGKNQSFECLQNMAALTILVLTVVVNVSIQISTGVIFLFIAEHIVIICCMISLLLALWVSTMDINNQKRGSIDNNKGILTEEDQGSMLQRLKLAYLHGYNHNPQFILCRQPNCHLVGVLCVLCLVINLRVIFSSLVQKFCGGYSDYDWSMSIIVLSQILMIAIGSSATIFRSWYTLKNLKYNPIGKALKNETRTLVNSNPLLINDYYGEVSHLLMMLQIGFGICFVILPLCLVLIVIRKLVGHTLRFKNKLSKDGDIQEYEHLINDDDMGFDRWSLARSVQDMKKWMEVSKSAPLDHLSELLSRKPPSRPLQPMELKSHLGPNQDGVQPEQESIKVSFLSMVLLVRITEVLLPSKFSRSLLQAYSEACETIQYIDDKIISVTGEDRTKSVLAKAVRLGDDFSRQIIFKVPINRGASQNHLTDLDRALGLILRLNSTLPLDIVWKEVGMISRFLNCKEYSGIEDLHDYIEQLFVDMLHMYLSQIPTAIFKEVTESPAEEFDKRIRTALKFVCKFESLEDLIQWSFPLQWKNSSLVTTPDRSLTSAHVIYNAGGDIVSDNASVPCDDVNVDDHATSLDEGLIVDEGAVATNEDVIVEIDSE